MKIYKVWIGYRGMQSWLDCSIKYVRCSRRPTEMEILKFFKINENLTLFSTEGYVWRIEEYKTEEPEIIEMSFSEE